MLRSVIMTMPKAINDLPSGLSIWARYKASSMTAISNGAAVAQWDDISGNSRHLVQATSARRPIKRNTASGLSGNTAAIEFLGNNTDPHFLEVPNMTALTQGQIFAFLKNDTDTDEAGPTNLNTRRIWEMGTGVDGYYQYSILSIQGIYETFGTTARKSSEVGVSLTGTLAVWHSYTVLSASSLFTTWRNNVQKFTTASNTVGFKSTPIIGGHLTGTNGLRLSNKLMAEIIILDSPASSGQRADIQQYFETEYT